MEDKNQKRGPPRSTNFELKWRGSQALEEVESLLLGLATHTHDGTNEGEKDNLEVKSNGSAHTWQVYSRNKGVKRKWASTKQLISKLDIQHKKIPMPHISVIYHHQR